MALNKNHFEAMGNLRKDFQQYQEEHQRQMNEQTMLLKEEYSMWQQFNNCRPSQGYEEEIDNVSNYLNEMDKIIREKEEMINEMRNQYERMRV